MLQCIQVLRDICPCHKEHQLFRDDPRPVLLRIFHSQGWIWWRFESFIISILFIWTYTVSTAVAACVKFYTDTIAVFDMKEKENTFFANLEYVESLCVKQATGHIVLNSFWPATYHWSKEWHSTTVCKLVDLIQALHQSDCRIPN